MRTVTKYYPGHRSAAFLLLLLLLTIVLFSGSCQQKGPELKPVTANPKKPVKSPVTSWFDQDSRTLYVYSQKVVPMVVVVKDPLNTVRQEVFAGVVIPGQYYPLRINADSLMNGRYLIVVVAGYDPTYRNFYLLEITEGKKPHLAVFPQRGVFNTSASRAIF